MSHFRIFIPTDRIPEGVQKNAETLLPHVGLDTLIENAEVMNVGQGVGPEGKGGIMFCWRKPGDNDVAIRLEDDVWIPAARDGSLEPDRYWVGYRKDSPPTPSDLVRSFPFRGVVTRLGRGIMLGDGDLWHIPCIWELPKTIELDRESGLYRAEILSEWRYLWQMGDEWMQHYSKAIDRYDPLVESKMMDFLVKVINVNYRMTREMACELKLLMTSQIQQVMAIAIGADMFMESIKPEE